jgi:hydroxymethylbilane synthase
MRVKLGTRGSPLARAQTTNVLALLQNAYPDQEFEEHIINTTGDAVLDRPLAEIGGKGLFAKEIHEALLAGRIDIAVHSLKDLETTLPDGIILACTLKREDPRDVIVLPEGHAPTDPKNPFGCLPQGATIASASVRRQAQLLHARPDLKMTLIRGNVGTRLAKLAAGEAHATMLAFAGLRRLGLEQHASVVLNPNIMLPAAAQGIVGITIRAADTDLHEMLASIEDKDSKTAAIAERALLAALDGSCRTPIAGYAHITATGELHITGLAARADGSFLIKRFCSGAVSDAEKLGHELGLELKAGSPDDIFLP